MKAYHKNPRQITKQQYKDLEAWLEELGDLSGIVHDLNSNEIPAGNQRSRVFGIIKDQGNIVITETLDEPTPQGTVARGYIEWRGEQYAYRQVRWTERQCEQANIVANRAGGSWDWDILANEFEFADLLDWGFDEQTLLGGGLDIEIDEPESPLAQLDRADELQEKWQVKRGQVWEVGRHRLMCGDSTCAEDVGKLMDGERAEMLFTDPPYGVNYRGGHFHSGDVNIVRERAPLKGDKGDIYARFLPIVSSYVDGPCYTWFASSVGKPVYDAILGNRCEIHAMIIWHKTNATYAAMNAQYKQRHEPCLYFKPKGSTLRWCGATDECTLWEMDRLPSNENHPTEKPPTLAVRAIKNHTAQTVLDLFLGSGTTLIACEQLGRRGYGMEIEPKYCAVTLERLADMGLEPALLE